MMKKKLLIFMAIIAMFFVCSSVSAQGRVVLEYDGQTHEYTGSIYDLVVRDKPVYSDMSPIIFNDRALVPVREVCEAIGAQVNYSGNTQTIEIVDGTTYIKLKINDNTAVINGYKTAIPDNVVPKLISMAGGNAKTMVPVRFISESIGLDVQFDAENGKILVDSAGRELAVVTPTPAPTPTPTPTPVPTPIPTPTPTAKPTPTAVPQIPKSVMKSVTYTQSGSAIDVNIKLSSKVEYTYFTLSNPERLVVDFPNTEIDLSDTVYTVNKGGINAIRVGFTEERTRVVIDADSIISYSLKDSGNNVTIKLSAKKSAQSTTQTPTPTQFTANPTPTATPKPTPVPTKKPIKHTATERYVVIDAGHGGSDPGALGSLEEETIRESDLTLSIAKKVEAYVEDAGFKVYMTRDTDVYKTLVERPAYANELDAAVFVSIHINATANSEEANGTEVFYAESNNDDSYGTTSQELSKNLLKHMLKQMGSLNRGVKTAEHAVTKRSNMPASLVEVGFISNEEELKLMTTEAYQRKVARGIADGILETLEDIDIFD